MYLCVSTHIRDVFLAFTVPVYSESLRKNQANPGKNFLSLEGFF